MFISVNTASNTGHALKSIDKARSIIASDKRPETISRRPAYWKCKNLCNYKVHCFGNNVADVNCRTCTFSKPIIDDSTDVKWVCTLPEVGGELDEKMMLTDCANHLFIPSLLVSWASPTEWDLSQLISYITYENKLSDATFTNNIKYFSSKEIRKHLI